jgi:hypothetical protein
MGYSRAGMHHLGSAEKSIRVDGVLTAEEKGWLYWAKCWHCPRCVSIVG